MRNTYDSSTGLLTKTEQGNVNSQSDADWAAFSAAHATEILYDTHARPIVGKLTSGSTTYALGQSSYDALGRPECSAQRMNPAVFGSTLPAACSLGTQGSGAGDYGSDRIAKTFYDAAGRAYQTKTALGTADEATDVTATFTANGQVETVTDAENNKTTYEYDGHDRLAKTRFPSTTKGAGTSSTTDYEQPTYESLSGGTRTSGVVTAFRNRAGETIGFGHDALGRLISKDLPGTEPDATYGYDLLGRLLSAAQNGITIAFTYDALGRQLTQTIPIPLIATPVFSSEWDLAGRRTRYSWPVDASGSTAYYVDYDYLVTGEMEKVREKGATSGAGVLATFGYDDLGRRTGLTRGNGATTAYSYDAVSRLGSMTHDFGGSATTHDLTLGFAYNPASQIVEATRSNNLYSWTGHGSGTTSSTANGLNQLASHGGATATSDAKGNLTSDGTYTYAYSSENLLTSFGATGTLSYDPLMRFYENYSTYFIHEGGQLVGEYYNGNIVARYVPGAAGDEPVAQIDKFGTRTGFHSDERGSIIAGSNATGANSRIVTFDEYGKRGPGGSYRFAYTGQVHLLNDIYDYKARNYNARLGRFVQTDPIGYGAGMNMYAYVGGDPVNFTDPSGLQEEPVPVENIIFVTGQREERPALTGWAALIGAKSGDQSRFMANLVDLLGGGGGASGGDDGAVKLGKTCKGVAEFTAVGGNQAPDAGALAAFGITPDVGTVAVDPNQFGIRYGGSAAFNEAAQRRFAPLARQIGIISPAAAARSAQYGGPASSFFSIGDIGDKNVRSGDILRFDLYRFPTIDQARGFGREPASDNYELAARHALPSGHDGGVTMAIKPLALLTALVCAAASAYAALRNPPQISAPAALEHRQPALQSSATSRVRTSNLRIEQYSAGSCATLSVEGVEDPILDSCHGWSINDCDGLMLARSVGVRLDKAVILKSVPGDHRLSVVHLENLLEEALKQEKRGPYEYLQLRLLEPLCTSNGMTMNFQGSVIKVGATGSAAPVKGSARLGRDGTSSVAFQ